MYVIILFLTNWVHCVSLLIDTLIYKKYFVSPNKFNVHRQLLTNWTSFVSNDLNFELFSMIGTRRIRILIVNINRKIAIYHKKLQKAPYGSWTIKYTMLSWTLFFFGVPIKSFCQNEITVLKRTQSFQENMLHKSFYKNLRLETT